LGIAGAGACRTRRLPVAGGRVCGRVSDLFPAAARAALARASPCRRLRLRPGHRLLLAGHALAPGQHRRGSARRRDGGQAARGAPRRTAGRAFRFDNPHRSGGRAPGSQRAPAAHRARRDSRRAPIS
jgi:hypothetical protein